MKKVIAISGAGTMGSGIAQIFARAGHRVILSDIKQEFLDKSKHLIGVFNKSLIEEDLMEKEEEDKVFDNIEFVVGIDSFNEADIVIECIVEKLDIKQDYWVEVENVVDEDTILATNTSGLSINAISEKVKKKDRFIGTHFWNPAHLIPLVELIRGDETSDATVEFCKKLLEEIDKVPIVVKKDALGFVGNRLQFAVFREAMYILENGIADAEDIDKAMKYGPGFRYPIIGPLETADLGGLDTFYHIPTYLFADLADNKEPNEIITKLFENGDLGVKTNKGFYDYPGDSADKAIERRDRMLFTMLREIYNKELE